MRNISDAKSLKFTSREVVGRLIIATISLVVLIGILTSIIYYREANSQKEAIAERGLHTTKMLKETIDIHLGPVFADLSILVNNEKLNEFVVTDIENDLDAVAELFLSYSKAKKVFDQIRFLDEKGMEIVRVNFNKGEPYIVPKKELQDKGKRYYFNDTFQLSRGEIYISPVDLNIEQGQIEQPLKPMIRLGTPVFDSRGQKRGVVIVNYSASDLFEHFERVVSGVAVGDVMLLNSDGFWLRGPRKADEWGFMYEDKNHLTFGNAFPSAWQQMSRDDSGQFDTKAGLFTFTTLYPLSEAMKSSTGSPRPFEPSKAWIEQSEYHWKIVTQVSPNILIQEPRELLKRLLLVGGVLIVISAGILWFMFYSSLNHKRAEEALRKAHDELEERVQKRTLELRKANEALQTEVTDRKKAEYDLGERMKELKAIYGTSKIMEENSDLSKALGEIVEIMPPAYQFPAIACARIIYNGDEYKTKNFTKSPWGQSASIVISGKKVGVVEVFYLGEAPFLVEESKMIKEVASQIGNITERKKTEEKAKELYNLAVRRKAAEEEAEEMNQLKSEFLNIAAHELRTPLTAIRWSTSLIMQRFQKSLKDKKLKGMINDMHDSSIHLTEIVNDFLDVARLEAGRIDFKKEVVDLKSLIKQSLEGLKVVASKKSLYLKFEEPKKALPKVLADKGRVEQIIINLVGNAIKFTEKGGVSVDVAKEGGLLKVRVKDTGIGLERDSQKLLFQKFQQSGKGPYTRDATKGTGLGLYISKLLVGGMGGTIYLEKSEPNKGSIFTFTLPVSKATSSHQVSTK